MSSHFADLDWVPVFTFARRPVPMPADFRPAWKILSLCLILAHCCRGQRASLTKLHILSWCLKSESAQLAVISFVAGTLRPEAVVVRLEPSVNRAIDFGVAEGVFALTGGRVALTATGKSASQALDNLADVFVPEKEFLSKLGTSLTEDAVKRLSAVKA